MEQKRRMEDNRSREIDPYLPIGSFHDPIYIANVADPCALTIDCRIVFARLETRRDPSSSRSRSTTWRIQISARSSPPQPGNPHSRVHLIIIAKGAGGAARCPLNRSSTTSTPPPRNYESLRAGFHRGNTPGTLTGCYTPRNSLRSGYLRRPGVTTSVKPAAKWSTSSTYRPRDDDDNGNNNGRLATESSRSPTTLPDLVCVTCRRKLLSAVVSQIDAERRFRLTAARENPPPCDLLSRGSTSRHELPFRDRVTDVASESVDQFLSSLPKTNFQILHPRHVGRLPSDNDVVPTD